VRFAGTCYRSHNPRWAFKPLSGDGAAVHGGRFNPKGMPALYLSLTIETAIRETNQGFLHKMDPCTLCSYTVDCADIVDLRSDAARAARSVTFDAMACAWAEDIHRGRLPASWTLATRLIAAGAVGILVPSFAAHALAGDENLVLWKWGPRLPHKVAVHDPSGRLPKNQLSWD
jgi:RES domain-containing protein